MSKVSLKKKQKQNNFSTCVRPLDVLSLNFCLMYRLWMSTDRQLKQRGMNREEIKAGAVVSP